MLVHFDSTEAVVDDRCSHERPHSATIMNRVNEREAVEASWVSGDNLGYGTVGDAVIRVERGKQNCSSDASTVRAFHIVSKRRIGVPWPRQSITLSKMAVTIDDHNRFSFREAPTGSMPLQDSNSIGD